MIEVGRVETIKTRDDFVRFVEDLADEFRTKRDAWENHTIDDYLEGLASWVESMDGAYQNRDQPVPTNIPWQFVAQMLWAATVRE